jgi:ferrochelatase
MREDGINSAVVICLAPQNSRTSVGLYRRAAFAEAGAIEMDFIDGWADHPLLAQAFAERLQPVWQSVSARIGPAAPVLFTAHSVPCRTIQTQPADAPGPPSPNPPSPGLPSHGPDPYPVEAKRTAANVAALLAPMGLTAADWFFAFQSQGMSGGTWIGPTVEDTLAALRQEGHSAVVIQPIGFLCDHVEILYDIDIGFRDFASGIGLEVVRPQSLNASPLLTATLVDLARQGFARLAAKVPSEALSAPAL